MWTCSSESRRGFELTEKKTSSEVVLRSSFNDWKPIRLKKRPWGWELEKDIQIPYGHHFFYFQVDGVRCLNHVRDMMRMEDGLAYNMINIFPSPESESSDFDSDEEKERRKGIREKEQKELEELDVVETKNEEIVAAVLEATNSEEVVEEKGSKGKEKEDGSNFSLAKRGKSLSMFNPSREKEPKGWQKKMQELSSYSLVRRQTSYHSISQRLPLNQFLLDGVFDGEMDLSSDTTHNLTNERKLLVVMVGLPARGKSYTALKLCRYLNWVGCKAQDFNLKLYRTNSKEGFKTHEFFKLDNIEAVQERDKIMETALQDALDFLHHGGRVAILDGTNITVRRRRKIREFSESYSDDKFSLKICFLEIKCDDEAVLEQNITAIVESPEYSSMTTLTKEEAIADLQMKIKHYEAMYEEVGTCDYDKSYIKVIDVGRKIITNRISGFILSRILCFIMNLHSIPRPIYLCRHGESAYNVLEQLGGDPHLSEKGRLYAHKLADFVNEQLDVEVLNVWTSTMKRTIETSLYIRDKCAQFVKWKALDEIDVGICDGMTYKEIEQTYKDEFVERDKDKLRYRYPRGESYEDVVKRVEPVIMEIERSRRPLLIICHRAVLRCLYAYLTDLDKEKMTRQDIPLHTVFKITPNAYGTEVEKLPVPMDIINNS